MRDGWWGVLFSCTRDDGVVGVFYMSHTWGRERWRRCSIMSIVSFDIIKSVVVCIRMRCVVLDGMC